MTYKKFRKMIRNFYERHGRSLPWRKIRDPYAILISEIMLQQTQADRVIPKYESWLKKFPDLKTLAKASLRKVLREWQGLGYNRRALALHRLAKVCLEKYGGKLPETYEELLGLPGIGPYTAGAVMAFAYNTPIPIIETNIRTVFMYEFFPRNQKHIHDEEIMKLIRKTLDRENPREWYSALMDYGSFLKKTFGNPNARSQHYLKQTKFMGSNRQIRSGILKRITKKPATASELRVYFTQENIIALPEQISRNLKDLENEGFIKKKAGKYLIA